MDKLILGQYVPGDSYIHRLDPRTKLIASMWFIVLIFMASSWWTYLILLGFVLFAAKISEIPIRYYINGLKPRSEEHTSELQSRGHLVCRLLLEKKKKYSTERFRQRHVL